MGKRFSPGLIAEGRDIMNELIKFNCTHVHQGEDVEQFCEVLLSGKSSSDRNEIISWAVKQLLPDQVDTMDQKQMMDTVGLPSFEGSSEQQALQSWKLLIRLLGAKMRTASKPVEPNLLSDHGRHYINYIVHNVYSQECVGPANSGKFLQIPRDVMTDLSQKLSQNSKSPIPTLETLKAIKTELTSAVESLSLEQVGADKGKENGDVTTDENGDVKTDQKEHLTLTQAVSRFQRSLRDMDATYHSEFKAWIAAQEPRNDITCSDFEESVDLMCNMVTKISEKHLNNNTIRASAANIVQGIKHLSSDLKNK